jgi:bifunctional ADP-heptose synthase (sugar kinase/adenylyltransferase)
VISFDEETPLDLICRLKPDVLVKGGDYTIEGVVGAAEVEAAGGRVVLVDLIEGRSTTRLIDAIRLSHSPEEADAARVAVARSSEDAA